MKQLNSKPKHNIAFMIVTLLPALYWIVMIILAFHYKPEEINQNILCVIITAVFWYVVNFSTPKKGDYHPPIH